MTATKILQQRNAQLFSHYLRFGTILTKAFDYFSIAKLREYVPRNITYMGKVVRG